jgi:hypothetical protein
MRARDSYSIPERPPDPPAMRPGLYVSPTEHRFARPAPTSIPRPATRYEPGAFEGGWGVALIVLFLIGAGTSVVLLAMDFLRGAPCAP